MAKYDIERNYYNNGLCCVFEHDGQEYYADLCLVPYADYTECMIFKSENGQLTLKNARDLYCKRGLEVTEENLLACIEEFINDIECAKYEQGN